MSKHSADYIPYEFEIEAARAEAAARVKDIPDPRREYIGTYSIHGKNMTERVLARSSQAAEYEIRRQLSMVGWFPTNLKVVEANNSDTEIN